MSHRGRRRKHPREKRQPPYVNMECNTCGRILTMKKGKKGKCPICDGNGGKKEQRVGRHNRKVITLPPDPLPETEVKA